MYLSLIIDMELWKMVSKSTNRFQDMVHDTPVPKYYQIALSLKEQIKKNILKKGSKMLPERELAQLFGVSYFTIRQALNEIEKQGLIVRKHGNGNFVADFSNPGANFIQFIFFNLDYSIGQMIEGIEDGARPLGCNISVRDSGLDLSKEKQAVQKLMQIPESGLIFYPGMKNSQSNVSMIRYMQEMKYPYVLVDRFFDEVDSSYVVSDDLKGGYGMTEHLINLGHRRIACLASANIECSAVKNRIEGYKAALKDSGIPVDDGLIKNLHFTENIQTMNFDEIGDILRAWLQLESPPTAIFTTGDIMAVITMRILFDMGKKVPDDVSVTGFGGTDVAQFQLIPLTTVKLPVKEMGREAFNLLCRNISGDVSHNKIVLPPELIIRNSSAGCKQKG